MPLIGDGLPAVTVSEPQETYPISKMLLQATHYLMSHPGGGVTCSRVGRCETSKPGRRQLAMGANGAMSKAEELGAFASF
jgi:hypothetical protein